MYVWLLTVILAGAEPATPAPGNTPVVPGAHTSSRPRTADAMLTADWRRVRTADQLLQRMLAEGMRRSDTFASLVSAIHATDVIVYVERTLALPPGMSGRLLLQAVTRKDRYLRVQVRATLRPDQLIATIAHELRHALEIAADPSVVSDDALDALYRRIGHASGVPRGYETQAAVEAAAMVRGELRTAGPRTPNPAAALDAHDAAVSQGI